MRKLVVGAAQMRHPTMDPGEALPDSAEPRIEEASALVETASGLGCDFLCLPELFADPTQGTRMADFAEEIGGPATGWLSRTAKERNMALAGTVTLRQGGRLTNTGVFYDKHGELAGTYGKVHLPPGEREASQPGDAFPVFEVEGVKVGMQICYDLNFPEGCRILALKGAEMVFWPNMWGGMPEDHTDVLMRARAMENLVFLVSSGFYLSTGRSFRDPKLYSRTCVVDWGGQVLAEVGRRTGVCAAVLDFDEPRGIQLERGTTFLGHRRPEVYGEIAGKE